MSTELKKGDLVMTDMGLAWYDGKAARAEVEAITMARLLNATKE